MATETTDIAFVQVINLDEFKSIISRYKRHDLVRLRDSLIGKSRCILGQLREPQIGKVNRDGSPMTGQDFESWRRSAENALKCTDRQIEACSTYLHAMAMPPRAVLERLVEIASAVEDLDQDELAAVAISKHYLKGTEA